GDIWVLPMDGGVAGKAVPFLHSEFNEHFGQLSPDNHWMAYTSDESGQSEVYVRPFPAGEGQWRISVAGGEQPRWRGDGKELFFLAANGKMMAVAVRAVSESKSIFEPEAARALFDAHLAPGGQEYDVGADGNRFLLNSVAFAPLLNVVLNWDAGLKK